MSVLPCPLSLLGINPFEEGPMNPALNSVTTALHPFKKKDNDTPDESEKTPKKRREGKVQLKRATDGVTAATLNRQASALDAIGDMNDRFLEIDGTYGAASQESIAGRMAEEHHAGMFNVDAILKDHPNLIARTTESMGEPHAPADIRIFQDRKIVDEAQVKHCGTTAKTTFELSDTKYDGMKKIHPKDQDVAGLAEKRGTSGIGTRNYPDTARNASPILRYDEVSSEGLSRERALDIAKNPQKATQSILKDQVIKSAKNNAAISALCGGTFSTVQNVKAVRDGEKNPGEAMLNIVKDTVTGGVDGAVKSVAVAGMKAGLKRAGAQSLAKGSVPVVFVTTGVEVIKDVGRYATGAIDGEELAVRSVKTVVRGGGTWAGAKAGAAIGTAICPGVGTVIGSILGGITISIGLSYL